MRSRAPLLALAVFLALGLVPTGSAGESVQDGDLIVTFAGGLSPAKLPRRTLAPVVVRVAGDFRSVTGDQAQLPQLRRISVAINRQGRLFSRGLPYCRLGDIQSVNEASARKICGDAIVGTGHVGVQVRVAGQLPFMVWARLLVFNGTQRKGRKLILAQAYARDPPGAFVLTFAVSRHPGLFGTVMTTTLPPSARGWGYLTHFDMSLHRVYSYGGRQRSFVAAACTAPAGFDHALFPFARATYSFDDGRTPSLAIARDCRVSD